MPTAEAAAEPEAEADVGILAAAAGSDEEADGFVLGALIALGDNFVRYWRREGGLPTAFGELSEDLSSALAVGKLREDASRAVVDVSQAAFDFSSWAQACSEGIGFGACSPRRDKPAGGGSSLASLQALSHAWWTRWESEKELEDAEAEDEDPDDGILERIRRPFAELSDEVGGPAVVVTGALTIIVGPCLTPAYPAVASFVTMSQFGVPLQGTSMVLGLMSSIGMAAFWRKFPEEDNNRMLPRNAALVAGFCMVFDIWMAWTGGFSPFLSARCPHPEILTHALLDLVCAPPVIMNLGYMAGRSRQQMVPTMVIAAMGHFGFAAAGAVPPMKALFIFCVSSCFAVESMSALSHGLPEKAEALGMINRKRVQMSTDLVSFGWFCTGATELLGLLNVLPPYVTITCFLALDVMTKMGGCYIIMNRRDAVDNAHQYQRRALAQA